MLKKYKYPILPSIATHNEVEKNYIILGFILIYRFIYNYIFSPSIVFIILSYELLTYNIKMTILKNIKKMKWLKEGVKDGVKGSDVVKDGKDTNIYIV